MQMHWGAGLGTLTEGSVPQRSLLLWLALSHPSHGWICHPISTVGIYVVLYTCEHVSYTLRSLMGGTGKALSQPLTLQHLHLMSLWSTSALLQAGTEDQEGCSGSLLHLRNLKELKSMSIE